MSEIRSIDDLFGELIELDDPCARQAFLERIGRADPELQQQLQHLLRAHEQAGSFLGESTATDLTEPFESDAILGRVIGPYKLLQRIGEGGMGVVYMAEQKLPVKRRVALKIIKPGMDSQQVIARFEAERQALAMMDHPHIAKVLEAGTTEDQRPFFVMELVKGTPITDFCDQHRLQPEARLKLFMDVCHAVHHAHQKGIIHRDLKPSNVLVAKYDDQPNVKVIDFGVAKAINQELTERTMFTQFGQIVGTLEYMSPEQAQFNQLDIDTRSDIYSLGVLLYELLAGEKPFDQSRLRYAAFDEVLRIIREEEPLRPSARLRSSQTLDAIAEKRRIEPGRLGGLLNGDLDWIVMKAIEKDRARRYDSATRLAEDVAGYLNHEVISARPPTLGYRVKKAFARNRASFLMGGTLCCALVATSVLVTFAWRTADKERELADRRLSERNAVIERLRENQSERLFELAMEGDESGARKVLEQLEESYADLPDNPELDLQRAVFKLFGNDQERHDANSILESLVEKNTDWVIARSLLLASYVSIGEEWNYFDSVGELTSIVPSTFEEHLFRGYAFSFGLPARAVQDLQTAVELKRSSGIARALLSEALHRASLREAEQTRSLDLAEEALVESEIAAAILPPESRHALVAHLDANTGLLRTGMLRGIYTQTEVEARVRAVIFDFKRSLEMPYDASIHGAQLDALQVLATTKLVEMEDAELSTVLQIPEHVSPKPEVVVKVIQHLYGRGKLKRCAAICSEYEGLIDGFADFAFLPQIEFQLQSGMHIEDIRQLAIERIGKRSELEKRANGCNDWVLLKLLGEDELATERAQSWLEFCKAKEDEIPVAQDFPSIAERMTGTSVLDDAQILARSNMAAAKNHVAFWLGVDALARGERKVAKGHFQLASESSCYHQFVTSWGALFAERAEDDAWLPWLGASQQSTKQKP